MKILLAIAVSLALSAPAFAQQAKVLEIEQLRRTDPKTWHGQAWQNLKWGMGAGDVVDALGLKATDLSPHFLGFEVKAYRELIFNEKVDVSFRLDNDGSLFSIQLMLHDIPDPMDDVNFNTEDPVHSVCRIWSERVLKALKSRYGKPECKNGCEFRKKDLGLLIMHGDGGSTPCYSTVTYWDLKAWQKSKEEDAKMQKKEAEKL